MRRRRWTVGFCCGVFAVVSTMAQQRLIEITGVVSDSTGAAIANASVEFESNGNAVRTATDDTGNFTVLSTQPYGTLSISAPGFNTIKIEVSKINGPLHIKLEPAGLIERILITADEERIPSTPASQFVISTRALDLSGALTIDDVLRQAPGFSLFRRSGSLSANPTSQGVSLRGVGANGASRALVLVDGIPLNSPFGGWVYWNRLARTSV
ncbi:MAG TPA: carboxypeptidase regulatory-like domain-containing protein, partial [Pyrinomonadaceae bacterium]|nr:carboxypeptidase regulatory-like domain-containing protein [Pyrinomonadaceae bacterium]